MTQKLKTSNEKLEKYAENLEEKINERTAELEKLFEKSEKQRIATLVVLNDLNKTTMDLKKNEHFLNSILESVQDGVSVLNPDLTIRHVNGIMKKWYKENLPLEGKKCYKVYHNADKPCDPCPTLRCLETSKTEWNIVPGLPGSPVEWCGTSQNANRQRKELIISTLFCVLLELLIN